MRWRTALLAMTVVVGLEVAPNAARAGDPCDDLWYRRNAIYAEAGHCFDTARARRQFGRGCFAPYGRLNGRQQARVDRIKARERRLGC